MERDTVFPAWAFRTELNIQFAGMYAPVEFANTLRLIAEGELSVSPIDRRRRHRWAAERLSRVGDAA